MQTGTIIIKPVSINSEWAKLISTYQQQALTLAVQTFCMPKSPAFFPKTGNLLFCRLIPVLETLELAICSLAFLFLSSLFCSGKHDVE